MSGNSNTIIDNVVLTPGGVFDVDRLPPTVDIPAGEQGVGIQSIIASGPDNDGLVTLTITYTNNSSATTTFTSPMGNDGDKGDKGDDGAPGVSVTGITLESLPDGEYEFLINFSNGSQVRTDPFDTAKGDMGDQGLSAYQVAQADGFVGTQEEWLASLEGEPGAAAPVINEVTVTETSGNYELTLGFNEGADVTSDPFTLAVNESLGSLTDVSIGSAAPGQGLVYNGSNWINEAPNIVGHSDIPEGNQQQLRAITEVRRDPITGNLLSPIVWVIEAVAPVSPGVPTGAFSPTSATQYASDFPASVTLTLTADPDTNSFFSVDGSSVTMVVSVLLNGSTTSLWTASIAASDQPTNIGDQSVTTLPITLTPLTGADQVSGTLRIIVDAVVDNVTTAGSTTHEMVAFNFPIAEAADTTMAATYTATTYSFDGVIHTDQSGIATLTASNGVFVGAPTISASAATLTLGTVTVNAANTVATVPYTVAEPAATTTVTSTLTWDATAQPAGATGTNGETDVISNGVQIITIIGEPASNPTASGTPPADTSDSAFAIPPTVDFGIDSSSELGTGHYSYILANESGAYPSGGITELTGTNSATTTIQIPGTTAFPDPATSGYENRGIQIGWSEGGNYTVVTNLEDTDLETYHPILLWYNQTAAAAADIEALYPAVTMVATEVIIPSTAGIITGHTFTPTSGNFVMLLIPDTWQTVTSVSIVGDGNDQPVGVTVLPAGQITGITDSFGTSVLYQGFYVAGASPNVRLRIDSLS